MNGLIAAPATYQDFATVDAYIRSLSDQELQTWLDSTSAGQFIDLHRNRYYPIYMNMASLFWGKKSPADIQNFSIEAAKLTTRLNHYMERFLAALSGPDKLESASVNALANVSGWDFNLIESLLAQGKGLVIASFRFGFYYSIPLQLASQGFEVVAPFVTPKYRSVGAELARLRDRLRQGWSCVESRQDLQKVNNLARLEVVDLQSEGATLTLAEILKKGQIMFVFSEGNNGADGPWGGGSRIPINFMGLPSAPRTGIVRLAAFSGAPILPVISVMKSPDETEVVFGEPIIPMPGMKRLEREAFAEMATAKLYNFLAGFVDKNPGQWAGISAFHRWRVLPTHDGIAPKIIPQDLAPEFEQGAICRVPDQSSLLPIPLNKSEVWVDLLTLRSLEVPTWAVQVLPVLAGNGLDSDWLDRHAAKGGSRENVIRLVAELYNRKMVVIHRKPQPVAA